MRHSLFFRLIFMMFVICFSTVANSEEKTFDQNHTMWNSVLQKNMKDGLFAYGRLNTDLKNSNQKHDFDKYLQVLQSVDMKQFQGWSRNEQMAFLINAYNAYTVKLIIDHYPVKSIKDTGSFFRKPWSIQFFSLLGGSIKSLDPIEHEYLRPKYKDYRIHAAVNCASKSCPVLRSEAYTGVKLDQQLDEQMRLWLADPSRNQVGPKADKLQLSKIFDWYKQDFEEWGGGIYKIIERFGTEPMKPLAKNRTKIEFMEYSWDLNLWES